MVNGKFKKISIHKGVMAEDVKEKLIAFLKENKDIEFTQTEISRKTEISISSVSKWLEVLRSEGKIEVREVGACKLVKYKCDADGN